MKRNLKLWIIACLLSIVCAGCSGLSSRNLLSDSGIHSNITLDNVPEYTGEAAIEINKNVPYFTEEDFDLEEEIVLSSLDVLGRCGVVKMCVSPDTMPKDGEKRGEIGMVKPAGWHTVKYDCIEDMYLYNRCHLLGWQLSGLNKEERNLITGTRYLNVQGMLPYENKIANYVEDTGNEVLYRVTPIYKGQEKIARGVLMEAQSLEDDSLVFCVYAYNVQPGVWIDYATGESKEQEQSEPEHDKEDDFAEEKYILNTNTKKYHKTTCSAVEDMSEKNKEECVETEKELAEQGYSPCKLCCP